MLISGGNADAVNRAELLLNLELLFITFSVRFLILVGNPVLQYPTYQNCPAPLS